MTEELITGRIHFERGRCNGMRGIGFTVQSGGGIGGKEPPSPLQPVA